MRFDHWMAQRRDAVLRDWKSNRISYGLAVSRLVNDCGLGIDSACRLVENT